ncbi:TPA: hypothetical protein DEA21_03815 [Candidatus Uhrbacteria bacterium]|nr:hypothetical protein [Candidatus Uhrbacteria bacterium]
MYNCESNRKGKKSFAPAVRSVKHERTERSFTIEDQENQIKSSEQKFLFIKIFLGNEIRWIPDIPLKEIVFQWL